MIYPDQILRDKDPYDRGRFSEELVKQISGYLEHNTESLVIGINGAWGSGKSTLLDGIKTNLMKSKFALNKEFKLVIFEFNPWVFSGKEQLHFNFLNEFSIKIGSIAAKARKKIELFAKRISWISQFNGVAEKVTKKIEEFGEVSIEQLKEEVSQILTDENTKVVVVMDDIDRLAPSEILEVFQLVKLNANFKNTIFLLSFDKHVVIESINNHYKMDGEKYLEKIVQVDYSIPAFLPEQIESEFFKRLTDVLGKYSLKIDDTEMYFLWLYNGFKLYFRNIRDINRYFNSLNFRLHSIHQEIYIFDFLQIEAIRLFDHKSFEMIRDHYKEAQMHGKGSYHFLELDKIPNGITRKIYDNLFNNTNRKTNTIDYRISNLEFFDRYFSLSISTKDMREEEFKQFVYYSDSRFMLLAEAIKQNKIEFLLRRIIAIPETANKHDLVEAIGILFYVWDDFKDKFPHHWRNVWSAIMSIVLLAEDKKSAMKKVLDEALVSAQGFSPARFVFLWLILENINRDDDKNTDPKLDDFVELLKSRKTELERHWTHRLENIYTNFVFGDTLDNGLYQNIFFPSYAKYCPNKYIEQAGHMIRQGENIFKLVDILVFRDSESKEPMAINRKFIEILLPIKFKEDFIQILKALPPSTLSKSNEVTANGLIKFLESGIDPFVGLRTVSS